MKLRHLTLLLAVVGLGVAFLLWPSPEEQRVDRGQEDSNQVRPRRMPRERRVRRKPARRTRDVEAVRIPREKPVLDLGMEEEELGEAMRAVLAQLRKALNDANLASARKAVALLKAAGGGTAPGGMANWTKNVPKSLLNAAVETLGYFGGDAIADLLDFIADDDPDVAQFAIDQLELALQDVSLGDRERAEVIKSVSTVLTDTDALDWMLSFAIDARHSVGIDTLVYISQNGTPEAREMVPTYLELFTGGEEITTAAEAKNWLEMNPDEPDDDEFYGGQAERK